VSLAIVVNGLVNSLTVIKAASRLLETYWSQLPERDRASMLADITRHADFIAGVLSDIAHELPPLPLDVIDLRLAEAAHEEAADEGVDDPHESE
jgi:hypothetical protein